jgi:hypothetical protein
MSSSSSFAIPTNGRKVSKRKRVLEQDVISDGLDDQPTSRDASGKIILISFDKKWNINNK